MSPVKAKPAEMVVVKRKPAAPAPKAPAARRPDLHALADSSRLRCGWADPKVELYPAYHDEEWGVPIHDDRRLFEFLVLEGAQAGLSWSTVLRKRDAYRAAFAGFDPEQVARFDRRRIERLMKNPGIIRNRQKILSAVTNARAFLKVQEAFGSFDAYQWRFVEGRPRQNAWRSLREVPPFTRQSDAYSKDLRARGFGFVGTTIIYAHMQACGMVNDHLVGCFRHAECSRLR